MIRDADWQTYQGLLEALGDRPVRLTYDRGKLELMTLSLGHERCSRLLARLVETLTEELGVPLQNAGSTTFNREDLDRGLEPDQCFYFEQEQLLRGKDEIDLSEDPPPDLAIEIDVSRSSVNRMDIYAALGVTEVWRLDSKGLVSFHLREVTFELSTHSKRFPFLAMQDVLGFLEKRSEADDNQIVRSFRAWVRDGIAAGWQANPAKDA